MYVCVYIRDQYVRFMYLYNECMNVKETGAPPPPPPAPPASSFSCTISRYLNLAIFLITGDNLSPSENRSLIIILRELGSWRHTRFFCMPCVLQTL